MVSVFINRIGTAVPPHEVHGKFVAYAPALLCDERSRRLFRRMADKSQIERRYSVLEPDADPERLDTGGFYRRGAFPDTLARMRMFERTAFPLARRALGEMSFQPSRDCVTHLIVTCCTGLYAPGLDLDLIHAFGLPDTIERTV